MRIPVKPPDWQASLTTTAGEARLDLLQTLLRADVQALMRDANDRYLHWDRLRFQPLPEGITPPQAWAVVQLSRTPQFQELPLRSYSGKKKLKYWLPPRQQEWLSLIDQQAGRDREGEHDQRYRFNSLMEEAIASSQLEGAATTRAIGKELLRSGRAPRDHAERMILNNYQAILEIRDLQNESLTPALLCHLQGVLTAGTLDKPADAGRFRQASESIHVADKMTGQEIYTPPPADTIAARIQEVCDFSNENSVPFVHPVVKAMALHFAIGFIHPFVDGNGRTARALFYWYLLKSGYGLFEFLPISRVILAGPIKYARAYLYTETDDGDLTYFNYYHLDVVLRSLRAFHDYLAGQARLVKEGERLFVHYPQLNERQQALLAHLLKQPSETITAQEYEGQYRVAYNTARADLIALEVLGLLEKRKRVGGGKGWTYRATPALKEQSRKH